MTRRMETYAAAVGAAALLAGATAAVRLKRRMDLRGRSVLITGASRGLGLVLARQFAGQGANVAICARDMDELSRAREELDRQFKVDVVAVQCDITAREQVEGMIDGLNRHYGQIDVLVNNAGNIQVGPMESMTLDDYEQAMKLHFWAPLYATFAVLPGMRRRGEGRIVNVSSIGGKVAAPHLLPYSASKFALVGFSEGLRSELEKDGIYVTTVCPGLMRTGSRARAMFKGRHREEYTWFAVSDSLPLLSVSANVAARRIVRACKYGEAEIMLSLPARLAATFHGIFPGLASELNAWIHLALPEPGGIGKRAVRGQESETDVTRSELTSLTRKAARVNNEVT